MAVSNADIYNKLIDIEGRLCTVEAIAPVVAELQKVVIAGNGTPPMKERLNKVEDYIKGCKDSAADKKDDNKWLRRTAWGALITAVIGGLVAIAFLFVRLAPVLAAIK